MEQEQEHPDFRTEQEYGIHRCARHPDVETGLACGKCGTYICPRCMIQTPVGARCSECARVTKLPTFDVQPSHYLRAVLAGGLVGLAAGFVWGFVLRLYIPFLPWLVTIGVGYLVGEAVSVASNRKRGRGLAVTAGFSMVVAVVAMLLVAPAINFVFLLLFVALACFMAINRVR